MIYDFLIDLEKLEIIREIGEGSFGKVYLIKEIQTKKLLAGKVTKKKCISIEDQETFFKEIAIFSRVRNPAVLSFYGFNMMNFNKEHYPTILTDYMSNGSLDQVLNNNPYFPLSKKYIILLGIAEGMKYLHSQNIIHRDLKPGNILLDQYFYPHICDFGESKISRSSASSIIMESYRGTPAYMAPEVFLDEKYTYKIDVYSFSLIAFELLTGNKPFTETKSIFKFQNEILKGERPNINSINDIGIRTFFTKCWSSDPNERPSFTEIVEEIKRFKYRRIMKANEDEVIQYLRLFGEEIKTSKSALQQIAFTQTIGKNNSTNKYVISTINDNEFITLSDPALKCKISADRGNPKAMNNYGIMLKHGDGVPVDKSEAARYFKMSADMGNERAMLNYADMLRKGEGISPNMSEAAFYYKMAADRGNPKAINNYATVLKNGDGVSANKSEAARYYKQAADMGNERAMLNYADMLRTGDGISPNMSEAAQYFKIAADKGNVKAMNSYARMLYNGEGISPNMSEAAQYFKIAADKGNIKAMNSYASMLYNGEGISPNMSEAAQYFKIAADKGNIKAMNSYASMLYNGEGISPNMSEAMRYYKQAAGRGNADSMLCYADMLVNKEGVQASKSEVARRGDNCRGDVVDGRNSKAARYVKRAADGRISHPKLQNGECA